MTVWVKEICGIIDVDSVKTWMKENISVRRLTSLETVQNNDIIAVSNQDEEKGILQDYTTIIFEDYIEKISLSIMQEIGNNFDYYYLQNVLQYGKTENIDTIITGTSYGLFGIEGSLLTKEVNCSLGAQDLYYSIQNVYDICRVNKNIKNIVFCSGYYYFYLDLSKMQNPAELRRVHDVYYPIFSDLHNCLLMPRQTCGLLQSELFDIDKIVKLYSMSAFRNGYFNENRKRKNFTGGATGKERQKNGVSFVGMTRK